MLKTASFVYQWVSHLLCASLQDKLNISSLDDENYRTRTHLDDPDEEITNHVSVNLAEIHKSIKICKPWLGENIWSNKTVEPLLLCLHFKFRLLLWRQICFYFCIIDTVGVPKSTLVIKWVGMGNHVENLFLLY